MSQLKSVQERTEATSLVEVIRKALALYDLVTEASVEGGKLLLRRKGQNDGELETVQLVL